MIPADVASRLQLAADAALRPVAPAQELTDKLSDLVSGQRVMAEIQALLPNGTYRAIINQRDITLSLPFSAKAGDSLELEVVDSDGKLTLAVTSRPPGETSKLLAESVPTTLSRTGQLISTLFRNSGEADARPAPTALNGNQPIANAPPTSAQDLLPLLKQAITQSGMFYESHQAEWIDGRLGKSALLQEPQGRLSASAALNSLSSENQTNASPFVADGTQAKNGIVDTAAAKANAAALQQSTEGNDAHAILQRPQDKLMAEGKSIGEQLGAPRSAPDSAQTQNISAETSGSRASASTPQPSQLVAPQALPLVQQQLEALATQNFAWQGQIWPGQNMRWEIEEDAARHNLADDETANNWQTRLRLTLPNLGEVDAQIRLQGNQISLALTARNTETQELMRTSTASLRGQLDDAGLALASLGIGAVKDGVADGQAAG